MGLKIIKANEPMEVKQIITCIYGAPGTGKTTLANSAKNPLLLDFDHGAYRAANRKDTVVINSWAEVEGLTADDFKAYDTVIVDTAGRALDALAIDICERNPKHGTGGALKLQGFGELKSRFAKWLKLITSFGKDVILMAHMDEQKNGDDIIERIDAQGASKNEIYKSADAMGRLSMTQKGAVLDFSPTNASYGKNPGQLEPLQIPNINIAPEFMDSVIERIKGKLNALTEEQRILQKEIDEWKENVKALKTADDFNQAILSIKDKPNSIKFIVANAAAAADMVFDKKAKKYVDVKQAEAIPEAAA